MPKQTKSAEKQVSAPADKSVLMLHDALPLRRGAICVLPSSIAEAAIKLKIAMIPSKQQEAIAGHIRTTPPESDCAALHELIAARTPEKD